MGMGGRCARILCSATLGALLAASVCGAATAPAPLRFVTQGPPAGDTRVIDVRPERACTAASLAGARCLPASELFDREGRPVSFHVLRWLLGTVGLTGHENVLVVAGDPADAAAVGGLLLVAGERDVAVLDRAVEVPAGAAGGQARSMTREAVFTAPMRDHLLSTGQAAVGDATIDSGRPYDRFRTFAHRYADGAPAVRLRPFP